MLKNNLKIFRMKRNMTQKAFSEFLGIERTHYNKYEKGRNIPTLEYALEISDKLNKTVNEIWLLENKDK